jgi:hypothetical protein
VKAVGIALKLTLEGDNQLLYYQTYAFIAVVAVCVVFQMHYLNKALDVYNTAVVTPICESQADAFDFVSACTVSWGIMRAMSIDLYFLD